MGLVLYLFVAIFICTLVGFLGYSGVLLWHWKQYSTGDFTTFANMIFYGGVGVALILLMLSALIRLISLT